MQKILHGARILVYVNGRLFGVCTSFTWTSSTPRKRKHVIDISFPVELVATTSDVTWSMGVLRTVGDGGLQGAGMLAPNQPQLAREKYFPLMLVERLTGLTVFRSDLNQVDSESWSVTSKGLMAGQVTGGGIQWANESSTG